MDSISAAVSCLLLFVTATRPDKTQPDLVEADYDDERPGAVDLQYDETVNISEKGMYLGSPCEFTCHPRLYHVYCDPSTSTCQCDPKHPVQLGVSKGCSKQKKLGEQCFYNMACRAFDPHASCVQVNHNAFCQCDPGYHSTSHSRPTHRVFCTEDMVMLTADMPTLLGVASGIFVLAGLLCMVLNLYTRARFHPTHLADAHLTPPCLYSLNEEHTGGTMSATRPSSRSSVRSATTGGTLDSGCSRRASRARGVQVSASRAGSRRPSITSVQSSSSSIRSYSARRWEKDRELRERRQMSMKLAQLEMKMTAGRDGPKPTPSPRSPNNSTDGLLPAVCEIRELINNPEPKLQGVDGPCTSSSLY